MIETNPLTLITALRPNAWYVLGILVSLGQPVSQKGLLAVAKVRANTLSLAVAALLEYRLVMRVSRYSLQAAGPARQLVLGEAAPTLIESSERKPQKMRFPIHWFSTDRPPKCWRRWTTPALTSRPGRGWRAVPPRDPYLLKPIGGDLYAVIAERNLTELERSIMGARRDA